MKNKADTLIFRSFPVRGVAGAVCAGGIIRIDSRPCLGKKIRC